MKPTKGKWISPNGVLFTDRMIPVRIACTAEQMRKIIRITLNHYSDQLAVMAYLVSEQVHIVYREDYDEVNSKAQVQLARSQED